MKYQTLRIVASCLGILAWVVIVVGVIVSIIIGMGAATAIAKIGFLIGGFVGTGLFGLLLLASSKMVYLLIDIEDDLSKLAGTMKNKE
jgi:hypothetical protein